MEVFIAGLVHLVQLAEGEEGSANIRVFFSPFLMSHTRIRTPSPPLTSFVALKP